MVDPGGVVWRGDTSLPRREQGLVILGAPVGQVEFVKAQLEKKTVEHSVLLQRIPLVENLQAAWLLLSFCAAARANFIMRTVSPELGEAFATGHDDSVRACLGSLLNVDVAHVPSFEQMMTNLPLHMGGLGLRSAVRLYPGRSLGQLGRHRGHGARKASRSRNDPRGELDAPHSRDVNQQRPTVPAQVGWRWIKIAHVRSTG